MATQVQVQVQIIKIERSENSTEPWITEGRIARAIAAGGVLHPKADNFFRIEITGPNTARLSGGVFETETATFVRKMYQVMGPIDSAGNEYYNIIKGEIGTPFETMAEAYNAATSEFVLPDGKEEVEWEEARKLPGADFNTWYKENQEWQKKFKELNPCISHYAREESTIVWKKTPVYRTGYPWHIAEVWV